tara:strand:- start:432 stop:644 length:213 start_codon:yes stop_codon:yes gene_type:complete
MKTRSHNMVTHQKPQTETYVAPPMNLHERKMQGQRFAPVTLAAVNLGEIEPDVIDQWFARAVRPKSKENA